MRSYYRFDDWSGTEVSYSDHGQVIRSGHGWPGGWFKVCGAREGDTTGETEGGGKADNLVSVSHAFTKLKVKLFPAGQCRGSSRGSGSGGGRDDESFPSPRIVRPSHLPPPPPPWPCRYRRYRFYRVCRRAHVNASRVFRATLYSAGVRDTTHSGTVPARDFETSRHSSPRLERSWPAARDKSTDLGSFNLVCFNYSSHTDV